MLSESFCIFDLIFEIFFYNTQNEIEINLSQSNQNSEGRHQREIALWRESEYRTDENYSRRL